MELTSPPTRRSRTTRLGRDVASLSAFLLLALSARSSFADHYVVPSGSMLPTVRVGDHIAVNKLAFGFRVPFASRYATQGGDPRRGDVVVLRSPEDGEVLLKRVVAVPGDRVEVRGGQLVIDGVPASLRAAPDGLREQLGGREHPLSLASGGGPDLAERLIPAGHYLLLGDNRGNSQDGRHFGLVERDAILGRAAAVFLRGGVPTWSEL